MPTSPIVIIHSGWTAGRPTPMRRSARKTSPRHSRAIRPRPDVVVVGHSHREMRDSVIDGVHFVQPKPFGGSVSVVHLVLARDEEGRGRSGGSRPIWSRRKRFRPRTCLPSVSPPRATPSPIGSAHRSAWPRDRCVPPLPGSGPPRSSTSSMRCSAAGPAPTSPPPRPSISTPASTPTLFASAHILALYPRDNTLRAVRITGSQLKAYLEWSARYFSVDPAGRVTLNDSVPGYDYDIVGGARYDIDLRRPVGDRILGLSLRGEPVEPDDSLTMAVNGYRQSGAGGYDMLQGAPVVYDKGGEHSRAVDGGGADAWSHRSGGLRERGLAGGAGGLCRRRAQYFQHPGDTAARGRARHDHASHSRDRGPARRHAPAARRRPKPRWTVSPPPAVARHSGSMRETRWRARRSPAKPRAEPSSRCSIRWDTRPRCWAIAISTGAPTRCAAA